MYSYCTSEYAEVLAMAFRLQDPRECKNETCEGLLLKISNHHGSIIIIIIIMMLPSARQLPYAPTPYSYMPYSSLSANINLDQASTSRTNNILQSPPFSFPSTKIPRANMRLT